MPFLDELLRKKISIPFNDEKHYDLFYFNNKNEFRKFKRSFENSIIRQKLSTWYGKLSDVVTIFPIPHVDKMRRRPRIQKNTINNGHCRSLSGTSLEQDDYPIMFIAPAQLIPSNHMATVFEEFIYALRDINKYIKDGGINKFKCNGEFTLYIAVRFSQIEEQKMRGLFIHELFELVIRVIEEFGPRIDATSSTEITKYFNLAMYRKDAHQTGLLGYIQSRNNSNSTKNHGHENIQNGDSVYINLKVALDDLVSYLNELKNIDSLVIDTIVFADDIDVLKNVLGTSSDHKLDFTSDELPSSISRDRSLDFQMLRDAVIASKSISSSFIAKNQQSLDDAVAQIIFLLNVVGISFETPVKYIAQYNRLFKKSHHVFKQPGRTSKNMSILQTFFRRVREVDTDKGYKIRTFNARYWIFLFIAPAVSIVYLVFRWNEEWEDKIQTVTTLVTVIFAAISTVILNTIYKGEAFFDVLSNIRFIDTQEEFEEKDWKQTSDIIEVLHLSPKAPMFFGSGQTTSFLNRKTQNIGLQPKQVMSFSNLEATGYSLYECQKGYLYMFDPWGNVLRVYLVRNDEQTDSAFEEAEHGLYINRPRSDSSDHDDVHSRKIPVWKVSQQTKEEHPLQDKLRIDIEVIPKYISQIFKQPDRKLQANITIFCKSIKFSNREDIDYNKDFDISFYGDSSKAGDKDVSKKLPSANAVDTTTLKLISSSSQNEAKRLGWKVVHQGDALEPLLLSRVLPYKTRKRAVGLVGLYTQLDTHRFDIDNKDLFRMDVGIYKGTENDNNWRHQREEDDDDKDMNKMKIWLKKIFRPSHIVDSLHVSSAFQP